MINFSRCTPDFADTTHSLVKFLLPLDHDSLFLPPTLGLIDTLCHHGSLAHEIVAVDDASGDGTAMEARRFSHFMPLWLLQHGKRLGRSAAFRTAVEVACRDADDDDLLVPIDARRRPDPRAVLHAIRAAREGWSAVISESGQESSEKSSDRSPREVAVYRAALVKRHLSRFLETTPAADSEAMQQLEQYLFSEGILFHRLPVLLPRRPLSIPAPETVDNFLRLTTGGR